MTFTSTAFAIVVIAGASSAMELVSEPGRQLSVDEQRMMIDLSGRRARSVVMRAIDAAIPWFARQTDPHPDLADELFLWFGDTNDEINVRKARKTIDYWNNSPVSRSPDETQTFKVSRQIINGAKSQSGCIRTGTGANKGCIVDYDSVLQYIVYENYISTGGKWYKNPADLEGCAVTCEIADQDVNTCDATKGCNWHDGQCKSAVGNNTCDYDEDQYLRDIQEKERAYLEKRRQLLEKRRAEERQNARRLTGFCVGHGKSGSYRC